MGWDSVAYMFKFTLGRFSFITAQENGVLKNTSSWKSDSSRTLTDTSSSNTPFLSGTAISATSKWSGVCQLPNRYPICSHDSTSSAQDY